MNSCRDCKYQLACVNKSNTGYGKDCNSYQWVDHEEIKQIMADWRAEKCKSCKVGCKP